MCHKERAWITELKRHATKSNNVTLELDAEDVIRNFRSCSRYAMYLKRRSSVFERRSSTFDSSLPIVVEIVLVSELPSTFWSSVSFQSPHLGKLRGTGGISSSSPTLKIRAIPISAWNSMWQWNSQYPEKHIYINITIDNASLSLNQSQNKYCILLLYFIKEIYKLKFSLLIELDILISNTKVK